MSAPLKTLRVRHNTEPHRYLADDIFEYLLTKRGRETTALLALTALCIGGIVVCARYG